MLVSAAYKAGSGVSKAVSIGNEADLRAEDYLTYFADDADTDVIVIYMEGTQDGRRFFELARRVTPEKPVIVMKGGRTSTGIAAARSHTGAMAVSDDLFDASCAQAGIIRARGIDEAGILAASFVDRPLPKGRRVGIVTGGGGLGVISADLCTREGLEVVHLSEETLGEHRRASPLLVGAGQPGRPGGGPGLLGDHAHHRDPDAIPARSTPSSSPGWRRCASRSCACPRSTAAAWTCGTCGTRSAAIS